MQTTSLRGAYLSLQQMRLWPFQQKSQAYRALCTMKLEGKKKLDIAMLQQALHHVIEQHEILRTAFHVFADRDVPMQVIKDSDELFCPIINLEHVCNTDQVAQIHACFTQLKERPRDLALSLYESVIDVSLVQVSEYTCVLLACLPALCADGSTLKNLMTEFQHSYTCLLRGEEYRPEPLQYIDVSAWQNGLLTSEDFREQQAFWQKIDLSMLSTTRLPFEQKEMYAVRKLEAKEPFVPLCSVLPIAASLQEQILAFCRQQMVSPEVFLLACWHVLLGRISDRLPYPIGVACNGRYYEELTAAVGFYTRVVPFALSFTENISFTQLLTLVDIALKEVQQRQMYFSWELPAGDDTLPFFPVSFEFESWPTSLSDGELTCSLLQRYCCSEPFSLKLSVLQQDETLLLEVQFDPARFLPEHAQRLAELLHTLLQSTLSRSTAPIGALQILDLAEQQRLQHFFRGSQIPVPSEMLQQRFEAQVDSRPGQLAVICGDEALTYYQLNSRANQLAHFLRRQGVGPNVLVGLCLDRSVNMIVALLAILKAGGAYVPLDPEQPAARLAYQLEDLSTSLLLTQELFLSRFEEWDGFVFCLDREQERLAQEMVSNLERCNVSQDLAYVIYTSGSTGVPKGVMIPHQAVSNYTQSLCEILVPEPGLQFATVSTLAADLGNTAIFCSLVSGGSLHILPYAIVTSGLAFASYLDQHPIDILKIVPSHMQALLSTGSGKGLLPRCHLVLGGEALPEELLASLREVESSCCIINHYGPTETTIGSLVNVLGVLRESQGGEDGEKGNVPIGQPIANMQAYILDRGQIVPEGVIGELYLAGVGLATGYLKRPEQTAERFVPCPFKAGGERMYRTGDLAYYREDGLIAFCGRRDGQVKIRGFRVELREIETALNEHVSVRENAVVFRGDAPEDLQLIAYVVTRPSSPTSKELSHFLESLLPRYMLPTAFVFLRTLPLTSNGKVDRQLLTREKEDPQLYSLLDQKAELKMDIQPREEIEFQLLRIWEDLLNRRPISILDNFFDLGGHSILAVRLMSLIHKQFGQDLSLTTLFKAPTIAELAVVLRQETREISTGPALVKLAEGANTPFFCIHPAGAYVFCYTHLAHYLGPDQLFYGVQTPLTDEPSSDLEEMAAHYITTIRTVQPQGPYMLGGWSLGGVIAFEMALQLLNQGQEISLLAILDSGAPTLHTLTVPARSPIARPDLDDAALAQHILWILKMRDDVFVLDKPIPEEDLSLLKPEEQLAYACEQAKIAQFLPADVDLNLVRRIMIMRMMNVYAVSKYEPQKVYPGRITLFRATDSIKGAAGEGSAAIANGSAAQVDITRGWEKLTTEEIEVHLIPGNHREIVREPAVQMLATVLKECIAENGGV